MDPSTIIPVGAVTAMLVAVFGLFIRDSARNDARADAVAAKLVQGAEDERDHARAELSLARQDIDRLHRRVSQLERTLYLNQIIPPIEESDDADG